MSYSYVDSFQLARVKSMKYPIAVSLFRFNGNSLVKEGGNRFLTWIYSKTLDDLFPGRGINLEFYNSPEDAFSAARRYVHWLVCQGYIEHDECYDWLSAITAAEVNESSLSDPK